MVLIMPLSGPDGTQENDGTATALVIVTRVAVALCR